MSDISLTDLVKSLQDSQSAQIKLQTAGGRVVHLRCIYKESVAPNFLVVFPPEILPKTLDTRQPCVISLHDDRGAIIALTAIIVKIDSDRSLLLKATTTTDPKSMREYFRVDLRTAITISFEGMDTDSRRNWLMQGQTLDISASGVLGLFPYQPRNKHFISIELSLTYPEKKISCIGHVVRANRLRGGRWQVALHYDNITEKDRDAVIANCLWEQRRQLRENVQTTG